MPRSGKTTRTPLTTAHVEEWIATTTDKQADLFRQLVKPAHPTAREAALLAMSQLLQDAIEEVRVLSAQLREDSQPAWTRSADRVAPSARFLAPDTPAPESQIFRLFHAGPRPGERAQVGDEPH